LLTVSKHFAAESTESDLDSATAAIWTTLSSKCNSCFSIFWYLFMTKASNDAYIE